MGNTNTNPETKTYHEQKYIDDTLRLRAVLKTLPPFARDYFRAVPDFLQFVIHLFFPSMITS